MQPAELPGPPPGGIKVLSDIRRDITQDAKAREILFGATQYQQR